MSPQENEVTVAGQHTKVATAIAFGHAADAGRRLVEQLRDRLGGRTPVLVAVFPSTKQPLGDVARVLVEAFPHTVVIGASTAGEFTEAGDAKGTVAAFALVGDITVHAGIGHRLGDAPEQAVGDALASLPPRAEGRHRAAIVLLDPLSGRGAEAALLAAERLSRDGPVPLAGGAAGDDLAMTQTFVSLGPTSSSDAIVLAVLDMAEPVGLGVFHGHEPLSSPLRVTRAAGNVVHEVDGRPAWHVWAEHTRAAAAAQGVDVDTLEGDALGAFFLRYEAGLPSGASYTIRAPLARGADGSLTFAAAIAEGATLRIMQSDGPRQIASAAVAARCAREQLAGRPVAGALVFDCICRNLILGDRFKDAIEAISFELGRVPLAGFETYAEIGLDESDLSGFHNTTTVVLAFPE
jgi:methyl-accepting chemotaxis protein